LSSLIRTAMHCCDIPFISDNLSMDFFIRVINGVVVYTPITGKISCQHLFEEERAGAPFPPLIEFLSKIV
jgi:hypothetical protein